MWIKFGCSNGIDHLDLHLALRKYTTTRHGQSIRNRKQYGAVEVADLRPPSLIPACDTIGELSVVRPHLKAPSELIQYFTQLKCPQL